MASAPLKVDQTIALELLQARTQLGARALTGAFVGGVGERLLARRV